jgi:gamma-glutamylcyclotransferase (GGCT)/AIG2-like uncharacterized protein YtfP
MEQTQNNTDKHTTILKDNKMLLFSYGTLMMNYGNYQRILKDNSEFLGTFETEPVYTLFDGGFPIVERNGNTSIKGELHYTEYSEVINRVFALEGCSKTQHNPNSWYDYDLIETPYGTAVIFVMDKNKSGRNNKIESGIWTSLI